MANENDIDFVILWVDGSDPEWLKEKRKYEKAKEDDDTKQRYRDWNLLKFWFRGVEKFAPWVSKIHFVTWGHLPDWLNTSNPKLNIVRHEDFIPKDKLPLFNSASIECYIHKIPGLSENFVYFNDDFYLINKKKKEDYFVNGKPVDMLAFQPVVANPSNPVMTYHFINNSLLLSRHFNKRKGIKDYPGHYFHIGYPAMYFIYNILELAFPLFTGFYTVHGPSPLCKSTIETVWEKEEETLNESTQNRFRSKNDINQYVFREWQKLTGNFIPRNILRDFAYFEMTDDNKKLIKTITQQKKSTICINDTGKTSENQLVSLQLSKAFLTILPEASNYEKGI